MARKRKRLFEIEVVLDAMARLDRAVWSAMKSSKDDAHKVGIAPRSGNFDDR